MDQKSKGIVYNTLRWFLLGLAATGLVLLLFSILLWKTDLTERYTDLYTWISCGIGAMITGFGGGRTIQKRGILWGSCFGAGYIISLLFLLFLVTGGNVFPKFFRPELIVCLVISALSGTFSVNLRKE